MQSGVELARAPLASCPSCSEAGEGMQTGPGGSVVARISGGQGGGGDGERGGKNQEAMGRIGKQV